MNIIDFFDYGAARNPDRPFLINDGTVKTYRESQEATHRIAGAMAHSGLKLGSRVAIYSPNDDIAFECLFGLFRAGCAWVPINARNSVKENAQILRNADVDAVIFHSSFEGIIPELNAACPNLRIVACLDRNSTHAPSLASWIAASNAPRVQIDASCDDLYGIYSTGGTTGAPKSVLQTNLVMETKVSTFLIHTPPTKPPVYLLVAPWTHAGGSVAQCLTPHGVTVVVVPKFDPHTVLRAIERYRVTYMFLPPTAIYMLLAYPEVRRFGYSSLEYFLYAAAPMSAEKLEEAISVFGPVMFQTYGQVEAPTICTVFTREEHAEALNTPDRRRLRSCGRASSLTRVEIMDDDEKLLPPESPGEIVVRGNLVMKGYYKDPKATAEITTSNGWHRTGDIGLKDADGYIYIIDRKRDMIISGGFNIYPSEVEQVLWMHPAVQDCTVIGIPHEKWGEAVHAVIELKPGAKATAEEIMVLCREKLGAIKVPKSVEFCDELPRSPVGKVMKRAVRDRYWAGRDRSV